MLKDLPLPARLWSVEGSSPVCVLPHPCFVYSVCFSSAERLFTGAFDGCIRVWSVTADGAQVGLQCAHSVPRAARMTGCVFSPQLTVELRGALGLVNGLAWDPTAHLLYSGDSNGCVGVWREDKGEEPLRRACYARTVVLVPALS